MPLQRNEGTRSGSLGSNIRKALERRRLATPQTHPSSIRRTVMMGKTRRDIYIELCRRPCQSASQVARALKTSRANAIWHIQKLHKAGFISRVKQARATLYLPANLITDIDIPLFQILSDPIVRRCHIKVREKPGISHNELARAVGVSRQDLNWQVLKLVRTGLAEVLVDGRFRRYQPTQLFETRAKAHSRRTGPFRGALMKALREDGTAPTVVRVLPCSVLFKLRTGARTSVLEVPFDPYDWCLRLH